MSVVSISRRCAWLLAASAAKGCMDDERTGAGTAGEEGAPGKTELGHGVSPCGLLKQVIASGRYAGAPPDREA